MGAITVDKLGFRYQPAAGEVLKKISFTVEKGEIAALLGLSGCGKSTLCLCLSGIIPHLLGGKMTGRVLVNGKDTKDYKVAQLALEVGLVFQDPDTQLFLPTVEDEIAFAPENLCLPVAEVAARVNNVLEILGINDLRHANPNNLSGGQKQLVAMGAVLALNPGVLVLDEVMAPLDQEAKKRINEIINDLRRRGKTILLIEHDLESLSIADRVLVLENGLLIRDGQASAVLGERELLIQHKLKFEEEPGMDRWGL